jgi:hypothetical protein
MEVVAAAAAAAINAAGLHRVLTCRNGNFLDSF